MIAAAVFPTGGAAAALPHLLLSPGRHASLDGPPTPPVCLSQASLSVFCVNSFLSEALGSEILALSFNSDLIGLGGGVNANKAGGGAR